MANQHIFNNTLIITGSVTASDGFYGDGSGLTGITGVYEIGTGVNSIQPAAAPFNATASGEFSTIGGGICNTASGCCSTIGGGANNIASGAFSNIGGGQNNEACGCRSTIAGGYLNTVSNNYSTIGGGANNIASGSYSTVGGGQNNGACGCRSTIAGGYLNTVSNNYSTIGGGVNNIASGAYSTIGGGDNNTASGAYSTIGGGIFNTISGDCSTIAGGYSNTISCNCSTIAGGWLNTINSNFSGILGGRSNHTCGYANSFIIGSNICATAACYTFVNNLCNIGGGTSDCRLKENIKPVSYGLSELSRLEPVSYNFKTDDSKATKYGFLAQCVQEIMPELIKYHPTETVDGDKVLQFEKEAIWTSMINAIKELKNRVDILESKNN